MRNLRISLAPKFSLLALLLLLSCGASYAQFPCTASPNIGFQVPNIGNTTTWGQCLNSDLGLLDSLLGGIAILPAGTATPSIIGNTNWQTSNVGAVTITNFLNGFQGQTIRVICSPTDTFTSISSSATIVLSSGWSCSSSQAITLTLIGTKWYENSRSGGGGGGSSSFTALTTGANSTATMTVTTGASLLFSGTGTIDASKVAHIPFSAAGCSSTTFFNGLGNCVPIPAPGTLGQIPYRNGSGNLSGSSLVFTPSNSSCSYGGGVTCDDFTLPAASVCFGSISAVDPATSFPNEILFCNIPDNAVTGGLSGGGMTSFSVSKLPAVGATGYFTGATSLGVGSIAIGLDAITTDDPLDASAGPTLTGIQTTISITRNVGTIPEANAIKIRSPFNFATGSNTPGLETATVLYGLHINDLLAKGVTTNAIQIDSQTTCSGCKAINVASGGGLSSFQAISWSAVATLTTTAATSNTLTVTGMTSSGHCSLTPTNASAATNIATTFISAKTTNQITVTHVATSGMTYDALCSSN